MLVKNEKYLKIITISGDCVYDEKLKAIYYGLLFSPEKKYLRQHLIDR